MAERKYWQVLQAQVLDSGKCSGTNTRIIKREQFYLPKSKGVTAECYEQRDTADFQSNFTGKESKNAATDFRNDKIFNKNKELSKDFELLLKDVCQNNPHNLNPICNYIKNNKNKELIEALKNMEEEELNYFFLQVYYNYDLPSDKYINGMILDIVKKKLPYPYLNKFPLFFEIELLIGKTGDYKKLPPVEIGIEAKGKKKVFYF